VKVTAYEGFTLVVLFFMLIFLLASYGSCQEVSRIPQPFITGGLNIDSDGYQQFSGELGAGVFAEEKHFTISAEGTYNFMRKTNDNDQVPNEKGRVRQAESTVFYKINNWLLGVGAGWTETSLTTYMKSAWYPKLGGCRDFTFGRLTAMYLREENEVVRYPSLVHFTPGPGQGGLSYTCSLCGNGAKGVDIAFVYPNPKQKRHLFLSWKVTPIWFHETVTDPYNTPLTKTQKSQKEFGGGQTVGLLWRF